MVPHSPSIPSISLSLYLSISLLAFPGRKTRDSLIPLIFPFVYSERNTKEGSLHVPAPPRYTVYIPPDIWNNKPTEADTDNDKATHNNNEDAPCCLQYSVCISSPTPCLVFVLNLPPFSISSDTDIVMTV
jgi:hypothetical protein